MIRPNVALALAVLVWTAIVYRIGIHNVDPRLPLSHLKLADAPAAIAGTDQPVQVQRVRIAELAVDVAHTPVDDFRFQRARHRRGDVWQQHLGRVRGYASPAVAVDHRPQGQTYEGIVLLVVIGIVLPSTAATEVFGMGRGVRDRITAGGHVGRRRRLLSPPGRSALAAAAAAAFGIVVVVVIPTPPLLPFAAVPAPTIRGGGLGRPQQDVDEARVPILGGGVGVVGRGPHAGPRILEHGQTAGQVPVRTAMVLPPMMNALAAEREGRGGGRRPSEVGGGTTAPVAVGRRRARGGRDLGGDRRDDVRGGGLAARRRDLRRRGGAVAPA